MKDHSKLPPFLIQHNPWQKKSNPIWPATSFHLRRNLARFNFPPRLSKEEMNRLLPLLADAQLRALHGKEGQFYRADELSPLDKEFLFEHFFCEESFQNAGSGQGLVLALEGHFLALLNIRDHITFQWVDCCDTWEDTWNQLAKLERSMGSDLAYAFSSKFGYLTSHLAECGTALTVCAYLHVPVLNHTGQLTALLHDLEEVRMTGMEGTSEHLLADLLLVKNTYTLGVSEEGILRHVHLAATKIVGAERAERAKMTSDNDVAIKDRISRAYGLLIHSYQLDTRETLAALSMVKLGIDLGWVLGMTDEEVNAIFIQVRRAHLCNLLEQESSPEDMHDVQRQRAAFVHKRLKSVQLKETLL